MSMIGETVIAAVMLITLIVFIFRAVVIIRRDIRSLKNGYEKAENEYKAMHPDTALNYFNKENSFDILNQQTEVLHRSIPSDLNYGSEELLSDGVSFEFDEINPKPACLFSASSDKSLMKFFVSEFLKTVCLCAIFVAIVWVYIVLFL